jgi:hypothetical protein
VWKWTVWKVAAARLPFDAKEVRIATDSCAPGAVGELAVTCTLIALGPPPPPGVVIPGLYVNVAVFLAVSPAKPQVALTV